MSNKAKYILYSILDFGLTFGGSAGVIIYNYITPTNSLGFKLTFTGIILLVALIFTAKYIFEKNYQSKLDNYLQQLAMATDEAVKEEINKKISEHKIKNNIYQRLMILLPFAILFVVTFLGSTALSDLNGTVGLILASMGAGSVFNVLKKPVKEKLDMEKLNSKAKNKGATNGK